MRGTGIRAVAALCLVAAMGAAGPAGAQEGAAPGAEPVREVNLYVEEWRWLPDIVTVPRGTRVVLNVQSLGASRSFSLAAYKLKVPLPQGKTVRIEFLADRAGTFAWSCGRPCGDGCAKLRGKLLVQ
jgi:heme/copper-type cytochrome/quinol oxidase subunit 2